MNNENLKAAIANELHRIEEDALHSMKGHFNSCDTWGKVHLILGIPSAIFATWAGIEAFSNNIQLTAILALLSASLTATVTFLKPQSIADTHRSAGREYNKLKNRARRFREIDLILLSEEDSVKKVEEIATQRDELNSISPDISRNAYERAKKDIDRGRAEYKVDIEKNKNGFN